MAPPPVVREVVPDMEPVLAAIDQQSQRDAYRASRDPVAYASRHRAYNSSAWRIYEESGGRHGWPRTEEKELPLALAGN